MDTAKMSPTGSELTELIGQLESQIKINQRLVSEILTELIQEKNNAGAIDSDLNTFLAQMIGEHKQAETEHASLDVSHLFTQLIKEKINSGTSSAEIMAFLSQIMDQTKQKNLTAAEVSALWLQYLGDSMAVCVYKYFLSIVENEQIKPILQFALQLAESHLVKISGFLKSANFQVPVGFTEQDVNLKAPRLFSDAFLLFYSNMMTIHGLTAYSLAVTNAEREDIQNYFFECTVQSKQLFQKIMNVARNQPEFSSVPSVPSPHGTEFMDSAGIISNLFGDKRPLNTSEITSLFFNAKKTGFIRSLSLAFSQVAGLDDVRKFMLKNVKLAGEDADSFAAILEKDDLPIPERWDSDITDAKVSPFSDKLMIFHAAFLVNAALSYYGAALGSSLRSDIIVNYKIVFSHAMEAGALCFKIMVKHGWLEKQPEAADRKALVKS